MCKLGIPTSGDAGCTLLPTEMALFRSSHVELRFLVATWPLHMLNQRTQYYMEEQALWEIWQDYGVAGTSATNSAGSIRVYAHSTETRSSAPTAVMLRQRGQRKGSIRSLAWGTSVVSLLLTV